MDNFHTIRLNGPWQFQTSRTAFSALDVRDELTATQWVKTPIDWSAFLNEQAANCLRFVRSFNFPAALNRDETVWLCFETLSASTEVWLNGCRLESSDGTTNVRFDIRELIEPGNRLVLNWKHELSESDQPAVPFHAASLQIG